MTVPFTLFTANLNPSMSDFNTLINQLNALFANVTAAGDSAVAGNLAVTGTTALTGNATAAGTLTVTGLTTLNGGLAGGSSADIAINTNKFTVAASSGNTVIAGTLAVTGASTLTGLVTATAGVSAANNLTMTAAAKGLVLKQGANGKCGTFVANGASAVTVSNTSIAVTDTIVISLNTVGGTVGALPAIKTITAATGFTVAGTASDTSTYNYAVISNAA